MLSWCFKQTSKFPFYSSHNLLYSLEKNCSIWITIGLVMSDMYRHRISKGGLNLRGDYLKVVRSKNMLWKKFEILNCEVLIPTDDVFETFVKVANDLTMSCRSYLTLTERTKWAFSLMLLQDLCQTSWHSTYFLLYIYS